MLSTINSDTYWDKRFIEDWEVYEGPRQSRFFAQLALENLPTWLIEQIRRESLTVVDWGCAQGDGTDIWASYINSQQLFGVDFSKIAIEQARQRYPVIQFFCENWLEPDSEITQSYDVVFSSNTLEHFHNPFEVLATLSTKAKKAVILALPYREINRIAEHFSTFLSENIPLELDNGFRLVWSKVLDCSHIPSTQWSGDQVFLVYGDSSWIHSLQLRLSDCELEKNDLNTEFNILNQVVLERDIQIASLTRTVTDRDIQILNLTQAVIDKDIQIASLKKDLIDKESQVVELYNSTSWKITTPMRFLMTFFRSPFSLLYRMLKVVYWNLPSPIQQTIKSTRMLLLNKRNNIEKTYNDMSWYDFNSTILSNRKKYRGIFIQELVIDWNVPLFQRPQHIAAAFGRLDYLVIYRTDNWAGDNVNGFREVCPNVWITNSSKVKNIEGAVHSLYSTAYANTVDKIKDNKNGIWVYEYIDHIDPEISGDNENIKRLLKLKNFAFNGGVDYIVASAKKLYDEAVQAVGEEKVVLVPNGVDTKHYRNSIHQVTEIPNLLIDFKKKYKNVVGYFGALAPWLWYEAISELVSTRKDLGFVFIGPDYYGGAEKLPVGENILYLGSVDYKILPAYAQQFDICFIPFKPGEIARTTSPLKLFEYFALEKPVVVTSEMLECIQYSEVFKGGTVDELSQAFDVAINLKDETEFKNRLAKLADENDWTQRALVMTKCFENLK
ncbi:methyltransferase domain-containing protein [Acinetobacter sp. BSP-28]|uniref:methyltransferase domain-containing protein n=1 Tax=Acinetobacter sp. BSP-28 TaxID=3344661 RepID=UPI00376F71B0